MRNVSSDTGRYVEISMLPLSFREYCQVADVQASDEVKSAFDAYLDRIAYHYE